MSVAKLKKYQAAQLFCGNWVVIIVRFNGIMATNLEHGVFDTAAEAQDKANDLNGGAHD